MATDQPAGQPARKGGGRGSNGKFEATIDSAERDAQAAGLRARRMSYRAIAENMGYASHQSAIEAVRRALARVGRETILESRELLLEHLDQMAAVAWRILSTRHVVVQQGRIVKEDTPDGPLTLEDDSILLEALDRLLKIEKQRADVLGVAAPKRVEVVTRDAVDVAIAELEADLARRGAPGPAPVPETAPGPA